MKYNIVTFGEELLRSGDLDPVYLAIQNAKLDEATLHRLCLAYWCFYHLGAAAYIAHHGNTPKKFWQLMTMAALNTDFLKDTPTYKAKAEKPWPRGAERRHFRAENAIKPMAYLAARYKTATDAVLGMLGAPTQKAAAHFDIATPTTFKTVASAVETHPGFGPWMSFKIADMAERVLGCHVDFSDCELGIYKDPRQGAAVAWLEWQRPFFVYSDEPWNMPITDAQLKETVAHYVKMFGEFKAPGGDRKVNVQEVETIFCKYKSHLKGHYPPGKDTREVAHGLEGWGPIADKLRLGLPQPKLF